jgi:hypothetical protein
MGTKYIVNNVSGQTITGDLTINGNVFITGTTNNNIGRYKALLTQTYPINGTNLMAFDYGLVIGETYTIITGQTGDDFSNIANVQSGTINETGCVFIATGQTPTNWTNGTELTSSGELVVDVVENTLGFDIVWVQTPFGGTGYYVGFNSLFGPMLGQFPRNRTDVKSQFTYPFDFGPIGIPPIATAGIGSFIAINSFVYLQMYYDGGLINDALYYTPIEIDIKKDLDTTPIAVYGLNVSEFPYGNVSVTLYAGNNEVATFYNDNNIVVNNITEMVEALNADAGTNYLGTYSVNEGVVDGVILTMATNLKNQFSPNNTLTFEVFND